MPCLDPKPFAFLLWLIVAVGACGQQTRARPGGPEQRAAASAAPARDEYVGDAACQGCHREKVESFHQTAHSLTSRLPSHESILGSFGRDSNVLKTSNPDLFFRMEEKGGEFLETAVEGTPPYDSPHSEKIALVVGSGGKGETFAYWRGDLLFQLPVSYWTKLGWVNSPGYEDGTANFSRPIIPRCLECHATYFTAVPPVPNRYKQTGFTVGITCEKCHGEGRAHAAQYSQKNAAASDPQILNPARFPRERQMDLCGWCHAGHGSALQPTFSYRSGQPLGKYISFPAMPANAPVDVHGSQVELLKKSKCYASSSMTCLTCHDVHLPQHDLASFSERCLTCHKVESCGVFAKQGKQFASNCIDCHMPKQETNLIVFDANGKKAKPEVRNHWIKVYSAGQ